jgi:phosphate transport system substrate-binding protein
VGQGVQGYEGVGSRAGIDRLNSLVFNFACTDACLNDEQLKKARQSGGEVLHIPLALGAVAVAYNLDKVSEPLIFTGPVLADIFLGKITRWNDKAVKDLNPTATLPDTEIKVVHRRRGSGTTVIWTDYLSKVSSEWRSKVGSDLVVAWPTGSDRSAIAGVGNAGVVEEIKNAPGSIGYVDLGHAVKAGLQIALVKNKEKIPIKPSLASVTAAAAGSGLAEVPDDLRYSLTDAAGEDAYPICGMTWAIVFVKQPAGKKAELAAFLHWAVHEGQNTAVKLDHATLPQALVQRVDKKLEQLRTEK